YKTGCATIEIADAVSRGGQGLSDADAQRCFKLIPNKPYRFTEVLQFNGKQFYRIQISNGDLVWTYILSDRNVQVIYPGAIVTFRDRNNAGKPRGCYDLNNAVALDRIPEAGTQAGEAARDRFVDAHPFPQKITSESLKNVCVPLFNNKDYKVVKV